MEKGEGRREKGEGRREKGEGRREKGEGRREKGEGRREKRCGTHVDLISQGQGESVQICSSLSSPLYSCSNNK